MALSDSDRITTLEANNKNVMDLLKNTNEKVEKIYEFIFEWGMEKKYAKKDSVDRLWKIVWSIIGVVFITLGWALLNQIIR